MYTVLLAAALGFAAWIVQRALNRADEQRRVASRLRAYLLYWQKRALAMGLWKVLHIGEEWFGEDQAVYRAGGKSNERAQKLVDIENKYQKALREQLMAELVKSEPDFSTLFESQAMLAKVKERSPELRAETIEQIIQTRKELMEGRTFVTDSDVSVLDIPTVARAVELRLTFAGLLEQAIGVLQYVSLLDEKLIVASLKEQIGNSVLAAVRAGYAIKFLTGRCEFYLKRGKLAAVKANLFV